jgi:hypothetical protein
VFMVQSNARTWNEEMNVGSYVDFGDTMTGPADVPCVWECYCRRLLLGSRKYPDVRKEKEVCSTSRLPTQAAQWICIRTRANDIEFDFRCSVSCSTTCHSWSVQASGFSVDVAG